MARPFVSLFYGIKIQRAFMKLSKWLNQNQWVYPLWVVSSYVINYFFVQDFLHDIEWKSSHEDIIFFRALCFVFWLFSPVTCLFSMGLGAAIYLFFVAAKLGGMLF